MTPPIKVMPLGDSITAGTNAWASYRCVLQQNLTAAGYPFKFVGSVHGQWGNSNADLTPPQSCPMVDWDEEGHSGWAIYHILNGVPGSWPGNLQSWAAAALPDVVLIHLGTNNFVYGPPEYPAPDVDAAVSQMGQVIDTLRAANSRVKILLAQIIPSKFSSDTLTLIPVFNSRLPELAASKASPFSPILIVDQYSGFDADADTHDGTHPNEQGEAKLAARWLDGFNRIMKIQHWTFFPQVFK